MQGGGFEPPKLSRQSYSLIPLAARESPPKNGRLFSLSRGPLSTNKRIQRKNGAGERSRTPDRLITSQLLYQLSYASPNPIYKIGVAILVNVEVIINKLNVIKRFFSVFLHRSGYEREKIAYMVNFM